MPFKSQVIEITRMERLLYKWPCSVGLRYRINRMKRQEAASMRGYIRRNIKTMDADPLRALVNRIDNGVDND